MSEESAEHTEQSDAEAAQAPIELPPAVAAQPLATEHPGDEQPTVSEEPPSVSEEPPTDEEPSIAAEPATDEQAPAAEDPTAAEPSAEAIPTSEESLAGAATAVDHIPGDVAPTWPFVVEGVAWLAFAAAMVWVLLGTPSGVPTYEAELYPAFLLGGLVLTAIGPVVIVLVWLATRGKATDRGHLFISALYRGAVATMSGVVIWWIALLVIDQIRLGRIL